MCIRRHLLLLTTCVSSFLLVPSLSSEVSESKYHSVTRKTNAAVLRGVNPKAFESITLEMFFPAVDTLLSRRISIETMSQIATFEILSAHFLRSRDIDLQSFTVTDQTLEATIAYPFVQIIENRDSASFVNETTLLKESLRVKAVVLIGEMQGSAIVQLFQSQWQSYNALLSVGGLEMFGQDNAPISPEKVARTMVWLIAALIVSCLALVAAMFYRWRVRRSTRDERQNERKPEAWNKPAFDNHIRAELEINIDEILGVEVISTRSPPAPQRRIIGTLVDM